MTDNLWERYIAARDAAEGARQRYVLLFEDYVFFLREMDGRRHDLRFGRPLRAPSLAELGADARESRAKMKEASQAWKDACREWNRLAAEVDAELLRGGR